MASCEESEEPEGMAAATVTADCPQWCTFHRVGHEAEEHGHVVHVSGALVVNRTVLRLASSLDADTGALDGPVVYVGEEEYTLHQAEVLIDALTQLVDEGTGRTDFTGSRPDHVSDSRQ